MTILSYYGNLVGNPDSVAASCLDNICLVSRQVSSYYFRIKLMRSD